MDKLTPQDGQTPDVVAENIERLREIFPQVFADGKVDFETLKQTLGEYVDDREERYSFTWHGKSRARRIAQMPSSGTLLPCKEESVNWDSTQNIFIEGDNLEVLKLLQKSYHRKVKMIYIDPPYNTGKQFIYSDKYQDNLKTYLKYTGQVDDEGFKLSANTENSGRYHTKWLNMMYPRLKLARNLLRDDGAIFISIDDHEQHNLRQLLDEIFGQENLLAQFAWRTDGNFDNQAKFKRCHEYIVVYARHAESFPMPTAVDANVPKTSKIYRSEIRNTIVKNGPKNPVSEVVLPSGFPTDFEAGLIEARKDAWPHYLTAVGVRDFALEDSVSVSSGWSSKELLLRFISADFRPIKDAKGQDTRFVVTKSGAIEAVKKRTNNPSHVITMLQGLGGPQKAAAQLNHLGVVFDDYPKPVDLLKYFVQMTSDKGGLYMDFFAGSGTLGEAVMREEMQNPSERRYVLVQLPETIANTTKAYAAGYRSISQICAERLRKVTEELGRKTLGFKAFKLSSSNLKPWDTEFEEIDGALLGAIDNVKSDRSQEDVLYELLLKYGLDLAIPVDERSIASKTVYVIGAGALVVCLDSNIDLDVVKGIAALKTELQPEVMRVVFKDAGFANDVVKTNTVQILKEVGVDDVKSL